MVHLVGIGGGGCNVLEYALKLNFKAEYTFISSPIRKYLPSEVKFIEYVSPENYFLDSTWIERNIEIPESIQTIIKSRRKTIYIAGLRGYTGSLLVKAIVKKLLSDNLYNTDYHHFILSLPFNNEGSMGTNNALKVARQILKYPNMNLYKLEDIRSSCVDLTIADAFLKADELAYSKIQNISNAIK